MSTDHVEANLLEKINVLQEEKATVMSAISDHLDQVLTCGKLMVQDSGACPDSRQDVLRALRMCTHACRNFHKRLSHEFVRNLQQRLADPNRGTAPNRVADPDGVADPVADPDGVADPDSRADLVRMADMDRVAVSDRASVPRVADLNRGADPFRVADPDSSADPWRMADLDRVADPFRGADPDRGADPFRASDPDSGTNPFGVTGPIRVADPNGGADPNRTAVPFRVTDPGRVTDPNRVADPNRAAVPSGTADPDSSYELPPSYQDVLDAQVQLNAYGHNIIVDMTNLAIAASDDAIPVSRDSSNILRAMFRPTKPLPQGKDMTYEEKSHWPISTHFGIWKFLQESDWVFEEEYLCFIPPRQTSYNVRVEWMQMHKGKINVALGIVNNPKPGVDLYRRTDKALTTGPGKRRKLEALVDLREKFGLWTSIYSEGDGTMVKDFTLTAWPLDWEDGGWQ